MNILKDI